MISSPKKLSHQFELRNIKGIPQFVLSVENNVKCDVLLGQLKAKLKKYNLNHDVFTCDTEKGEISISKENFIKWQKAKIDQKLVGKRIPVTQRKFYKNGENYFTIPLKKETGQSLKNSLTKNANQRALDITFMLNKEFDIVEISANDYKVFSENKKARQKAVPFNKREFHKDKDCYYTTPTPGETFNRFVERIRNALSRVKIDTAILNFNMALNRVEVSHDNFLIIQDLFKKKETPKILTHKRNFIESESCWYTNPRIEFNESLPDLLTALKGYFDKKHKELNIEPYIDEANNRVCLAKRDYLAWKDKLNSHEIHYVRKLIDRDFSFDSSKNVWFLKCRQNERMSTLHGTVIESCQNLALSENMFKIRQDKNRIEISDENYKLYKYASLKHAASMNKSYSLKLIKDAEHRVYYYQRLSDPQRSKNYANITRSFNILAKLLDIDVTFYNKRGRTEISFNDYEKWIANPIIKESLSQNDVSEVSEVSEAKLPSKSRATERPQTMERTTGSISHKYLEDAIRVPLDINSAKEGQSQSLSTKGQVLSFQQINKVFFKNSDKSYKKSLLLKFQGIEANITIYSTGENRLDHIFSKNIIFIRAGRKESAWIPVIKQQTNTNIVVLMTRLEYEEMEKSLSFSIKFKLPSYLKICVIDSCSVKNQPVDQAESYLRSSNIKRIISFALAEHCRLKDFILMDDNTTQIQMADKLCEDNSVEAFIQLCREYQKRGTICATVGTYAAYKNITRPLEATEIEDVAEKLGSKIMYVDYAAIRAKSISEKIELHELLSPCSLWWGEDYFNMLAILQLMENESRNALVGVIPFSVAWHVRSQMQMNKEKGITHFQLANIWLNEVNESYFATLSEHQQIVVKKLQEVIKEAVEQQKQRELKYLEKLQKITESELEQPPRIDEKSSVFQIGQRYGIKAAKRGYECNDEKLNKSAHKRYNENDAREYMMGFKQGHRDTWNALPLEARAFGRGFQEGYLAAKQGFSAKHVEHQIPPLIYHEHKNIFQRGFTKGYHLQFDAMSEEEKKQAQQNYKNMKLKLKAAQMGSEHAQSGFEINEEKLKELAKTFGEAADLFTENYRCAYQKAHDAMTEEEIIIKKARNVAALLRDKTVELDIKKLTQASKAFNANAILYKNTVIKEFERLKATSKHTTEIGLRAHQPS